MRLIVLDTNVLVSAGIKPGGVPAAILMDWVLEGLVQLMTSPIIVAEYREVVRRPKFARYGFPPSWLEFVIGESLWLADPSPWGYVCPDPKDAPFLALAEAAGAWLVTENLKHFPENVRGGVRVITPSEYLAHLEGEKAS